MKRDVDLIRQMLFEIERQGADCSFEALRNGTQHEFDERARYHLRLIIDAGLAKECERTTSGAPCVRLTCAGHEFIEICRGEERWQAAKWLVHEQTGGLSLTVLRAVLTKWAVEGISRVERHRRWRRSYRAQLERDYYNDAPMGEPPVAPPPYHVASYRYEREPFYEAEPMHLVRPRRDYREAVPPAAYWNNDGSRGEEAVAEQPLGVSLPINMI